MAEQERPDDLSIAASAVLLFLPLFIVRAAGPIDFWWWMSLNLCILIGMALSLDRNFRLAIRNDLRSGAGRKILLGFLAAAVLYAVFFIGNILARLILPFAGSGIGAVYAFKSTASPVRIVLLMALLIGPGEEVFWRGFLQRRWQARFGADRGFLLATGLYAAVHIGSGNAMLVLAAAVCGLFWGYLYRRTGSLLLVAVSHTVWDLAVFVLFPFGG
jgi:uncharacterized protein